MCNCNSSVDIDELETRLTHLEERLDSLKDRPPVEPESGLTF